MATISFFFMGESYTFDQSFDHPLYTLQQKSQVEHLAVITKPSLLIAQRKLGGIHCEIRPGQHFAWGNLNHAILLPL